MTGEEKFLQLINVLAKTANFELDTDLIGIYDKHLSKFGYDRVNVALENIFIERDSRDPFPSVAFIVRAMNVGTSDQAVAEDVSNRIMASIRRHGNNWPGGIGSDDDIVWFGKVGEDPIHKPFGCFQDAFEAECGELGWSIVKRMGGYSAVCSEFSNCKNIQMLRAQIREYAKSTIELSKAGKLHKPPSLPAIEDNSKLKQLTNETFKSIPGSKK